MIYLCSMTAASYQTVAAGTRYTVLPPPAGHVLAEASESIASLTGSCQSVCKIYYGEGGNASSGWHVSRTKPGTHFRHGACHNKSSVAIIPRLPVLARNALIEPTFATIRNERRKAAPRLRLDRAFQPRKH